MIDSTTVSDSDCEINLLPEHIVDQIKAGEVIERPATLLKELLENSIDADATKISLHIINNGLDLISVEDNGKGISFDDLPLAFCRHATSKINLFEDLYKLHSYGFRGEALASMASVSKVTCISNKANQPEATIQYFGGEMRTHRLDDELDIKESSCTKIFVKDLFYNTPVRIKFLQSQTSEKNQIKKIIHAFVLTHPEVEFSIKWDDSPRVVFPITTPEQLTSRIKKVFEKKKNPLELINFSNEYDGVKVHVYLSHNSSKSHAGKFQYIFINNRFVQDIQIHKIVLNSAQSIWPFGQTGNYIAFIDIESDQLDVNVHPNKTVVKLFQPSKIFSLLSNSIKQHLPKSQVVRDEYQANTSFSTNEGVTDINFKDINYRQRDFSEERTLGEYFNELDNTNSPPPISEITGWKIFIKNHHITLCQKDDKLFLFNNNKLLKVYIESLLNKQSDFTPIPLLVSSPIKMKKKPIKTLIHKLSFLGFELDYLNESTLVLRTFPKCFSTLPYTRILEQLIREYNSQEVIDSYLFSEEVEFDFHINESLFNKILDILPISLFLQKRACRVLTNNDLLALL